MLFLTTMLACGGGETLSPEAARGKVVYQNHCTSCHSSDPGRDGPVGPTVKGASQELIDARIMRGEYPVGYTPKRQTTLMIPMPQVASSIDDLAAYLE